MPEPTAQNETQRNRESLEAQIARYAELGIPNPSAPTTAPAPADGETAVEVEDPNARTEVITHDVPAASARKAATPKEGEV